MPRHRQYFPRDEAPVQLGDTGFIGVNARLEPHQLPPGYVSEAINMRFNRGVAETRLGMIFPPWTNKVTTGTTALTILRTSAVLATAVTGGNHGLATNSVVVISGATQAAYNGTFIVTVVDATTFTYPLASDPGVDATGSPVLNTYAISPWGTIYGVGSFNDPTTFQDYMIIAADGNVYFTQADNVATLMTLPSGVTIAETVEFRQAFNVLIMHRGDEKIPLKLEGIQQAWQLIEQTESGTGTQPIPNAKRSLFLQNRLFIPLRSDEIAFSDFNDYTRYAPITQEFKINQGSSDKIVNLAKFNDVTLIVFKDRSIYTLTDVYGDLSNARLDTLTDQFGLIAAKSVAHCGSDLLFLSAHGIMSIRQTEQNKLQSVTLPLSEPMQPLIDRINWRYAENAVAAYWNNRYYIAVPLDDAEVLGPELAAVGVVPLESQHAIPTETGKTYRLILGFNDVTLTNGSDVYSKSRDFVAQGTYVLVNVNVVGSSDAPIRTSLKKVTAGVNNVILIYDFLNQAWSGYDQSEGLMVKDMFVFPYNGQFRLFLVTQEGYIKQYEEDFEDQRDMPYIDLTVTSPPSVGNIFIVNGGTVVTAANDAVNGATTWGIAIAEVIQQNLWGDIISTAGFAPDAGIVWTSPNAKITQISQGIRITSTNGVMPTVFTTGTWATKREYATRQITSTMITRGYASPDGELSDYRWLCMDVQTWNPSFTVDLLTEGAKEEFNQITDRTKNRLHWYYPFDKADFDGDNTGGLFMDDGREDYSVQFGSSTGETSSIRLDTTTDGIQFGLHQESREQFHVKPSGRSARAKIVNETGRIRVLGAILEAQRQNKSALIKA